MLQLFPRLLIGGNSGGIVGCGLPLGTRYRGGGGARLGLSLAAPEVFSQGGGEAPLAASLLRTFRTVVHGNADYERKI
jgi:hypothetical protein